MFITIDFECHQNRLSPYLAAVYERGINKLLTIK
jgi:hypothetical protein